LRSRRRIFGVVVVATVVIVAGSLVAAGIVWSRVSTNGPLGDSQGPGGGWMCDPYLAPDKAITMTVGEFSVPPGVRVTIDSVSLVRSSGLFLAGTALFLHGDTDLLGDLRQFPPSPAILRQRKLPVVKGELTVPAIGATLAPTLPSNIYDFMLGLRPLSNRPGAQGHFQYAVVTYHDEIGHRYQRRTPLGGSVSARC
jgi:hypothetical protein